MKRRILIYAAYTYAPYNVDTVSITRGCGGSERAIMRLAEELAKDEDNEVTVSFTPIIEGRFRNINHIDKSKINDYFEEGEVDVVIVSRYVHYVIDHKLGKRNYLWLHDNTPHSWWAGKQFNRSALGNLFPLFDKVICVSNWHADKQRTLYDNTDNVTHIYNGVDQEDFPDNIDISKKQSGKIVFNCRTGGLQEAVNFFNAYKKYNNMAELHVFAQEDKLKDVQGSLDGVFDRGFVSNKQMIEELVSAEFWMNSSPCAETFCISSIEAQLCKCMPIIAPIGGMKEITPRYYDATNLETASYVSVKGKLNEDAIEQNYKHAKTFSWKKNANEFRNMIYKE